MNKGFVGILVLIVLAAAAAAGAYWFGTQKSGGSSLAQQPSPPGSPVDETASWEIYTNTKYKFTLRYPTNFLVRENDFSSIKDLHPKNKTEFSIDFTNDSNFKNKLLLANDKSILNVGLTLWRTNEESLAKALGEYHAFLGDHDMPSGVNRLINSITWLRRTYTNSSSITITEYTLLEEARLFVLEISPSDSQMNNIADQILSTFRFD